MEYIIRGPQGLYDMLCKVNDQVYTKVLTEMVTSPATKIQILNTNEEMQGGTGGEVGKPLSINPKVRVLDSTGQPLAGKK